ncbi:roadblock/LC7 domain-containing protein [Nonomuraea lactucae]|uniref:roadblock/LC7 domain-containing protein n=1 Tax=Nonomuraea lactucae TaxID=2249762 RepID=UPI000DE2713B|nr:roadblock/LC7 domain-containing protein [Nonomuraea lactucae]
MPETAATEQLIDVLTALREQVTGVSESIIATLDGLLVVADADTIHPESVAALAAATLGLGRRMAQQTGSGALREVITRGAGGHVVVLTIGERALLAVKGDEGLDLPAFLRESPRAVDQLEKLLSADVT